MVIPWLPAGHLVFPVRPSLSSVPQRADSFSFLPSSLGMHSCLLSLESHSPKTIFSLSPQLPGSSLWLAFRFSGRCEPSYRPPSWGPLKPSEWSPSSPSHLVWGEGEAPTYVPISKGIPLSSSLSGLCPFSHQTWVKASAGRTGSIKP